MKKRAVVIAILCFLMLGITVHLAAQKTAQQVQEPLPNFDIIANLQSLGGQLTQLSSSVETTNKQVLNKLDQVLANQQKILDELAIVKVRATRK